MELPILGGGSLRLAPSKIICVGLNYRDHVAESPTILAASDPRALPERPLLFPKTPNVLVAHGEAIVLPNAFLRASGVPEPRTDYEAELALVIGRRAKDIGPAEALDYVLGYTCFIDVSQREVQNGDRSGWWRGKSFDTFGPLGPVLAPASAIPDPSALAITGRLNGRVVQSASLSQLIFPVADLVSYISRNVTLEVGDIIATGTPSGVGPLHGGDVFEVEIPGIGILRSPVVEA